MYILSIWQKYNVEERIQEAIMTNSEDSKKELTPFWIMEYQVNVIYDMYLSGHCAQDCAKKIEYKEN